MAMNVTGEEVFSAETSTIPVLFYNCSKLNTSIVSQSGAILYNCSNLKTSRVYQNTLDFDDILYEVTYQAIAVAGICGNVLGTVFLLYTNVKQSFHVFLLSLMMNDAVYLLVALTRSILILLVSSESDLTPYYLRVFLTYLRVIQILFSNTTVFIITCWSLERFVSLCFPLRGKRIRSRRFAIVAICSGFVLNIAVFTPQFILQEVPKHGDSHISFTPLKWKNDNGSIARVYRSVGIIVIRYLPTAIAFLANTVLFIKLLRRKRRAFLFANRQSRKDRTRFDEFGTTVTLILITTFLLLSIVPSTTAQILAHNYPELYLNVNRKENGHYKTLVAFGKFVSAFSAANDFVVYILLSRRSRVTLKHTITKRWCNCLNSHPQVPLGSRAVFSRHSADSCKFSEHNLHHGDSTV